MEEFQDEAQQHGEITDFFNPGRGFAFLTFSTSEEAKACIAAMDGTEVAGKTIQMNLAKPKGNDYTIINTLTFLSDLVLLIMQVRKVPVEIRRREGRPLKRGGKSKSRM